MPDHHRSTGALIGWLGSSYYFRGFTDAGDPVISLAPSDGTALSYVLSNSNLAGTTITFNVSGPFTFCFAPGTAIAVPNGSIPVETLKIGDTVLTSGGTSARVRWVGRQTIAPWAQNGAAALIYVEANALGHGLPKRDLTITGDHALAMDGLLINASALVNGTTIRALGPDDVPFSITVYSIETETHDLILAEGVEAETFVDCAGRKAFDNYQEYLDLYGAERLIPEMTTPRISSQRLLPDTIKSRLGIATEDMSLNVPLSA